MRVYITVDTECREDRCVNGTFLEAAGYDKRVFGDFSNQSALGLDFIVKTLRKYSLKGVFFVDPFGSLSFGKDGLSSAIRYLIHSSQDVQIHLHPVQKNAYWYRDKLDPLNDFMSHYSEDKQFELIEEAKLLLYESGVPAGSLCCLRAGHYSADNKLYRAMKKAGILLSSNYNIDYVDKGICKIERREDLHNISRIEAEGVIEYPITNITTISGSRHCQVTALSFPEMKEALESAQRKGVEDFVIVTHSFEFLYEGKNNKGYKNHINRRRFIKLCQYLGNNTGIYDVVTFSNDVYQRRPILDDSLHTTGVSYALRVFEQGIKFLQRKIIKVLR